MTDRPPRIHLVTVLYRSEGEVDAFLDCLNAQDMPDWHLHAVDNASPDASAARVAMRGDPRMTVERSATNLGFAKGANKGLRAALSAGGALFVLINNDTSFGPDFLRRLMEVWSGQQAEVIAPRVMLRDRPETAWYAGGHFDHDWVFANRHDAYDPACGPTSVDFAPGCCLGFTRQVLERAGLLDESFFVYWEDVDYCLRLRQLGISIRYVPEPSLLHAGGSSSGGEFSPSYIQLYYRSYMQLLRKHFGAAHALRTASRLLLKERGQPHSDRSRLKVMAVAMARGMIAPLIPEVSSD